MKCYSNKIFPQSGYWDFSLGGEMKGIFFLYSAILLVMAVTGI